MRQRLIATLETLAAHPAALFAVLWALNALRFPYANLIHDARLYAFQAQNQAARGAFGHDLFLRFGSQDQFTPFSRLAAPMVAAFGVDWSFFLLYLLSNALLILSMQRLIRTLIDDTVVSTAALVCLVVSSLPYGGLGVFHVEEAFFTPRLLSCALALVALERALRAQYVAGLAFAATATVVHPLMGFGALLVVGATAAFDLLPRRGVLVAGAVAAAGGAMVLGHVPLGHALFGTMDEEWLRIVRNAASYDFPDWWSGDDWITASMSILIPAVAAATIGRGRPRAARFLAAAAIVGAIGVVATLIAGRVPYRLLLQGQPYRALWILQVLEIPVAFWLAAHWWHERLASRVAAVLLIGFFGLRGVFGLEFGLSFFACGLCAVFYQLPGSATKRREWVVPSLVTGLAIGCVLAMVARVWLIAASTTYLLSTFDPLMYIGLLANTPGPLIWFALALGAVALVARSRAAPRTIAVAAVGVALLTHSAAFAIPRLSLARNTQSARDRDNVFVRDYFEQQYHTRPSAPTVYEGIWSDLGFVWFDLQANSYFHLAQLSGVVFNRQTSIEAQHRAEVVKRFALEWHHAVERFMTRWDRMMASNLWGPDLETTAPTETDLRRLCRAEEEVDVAILNRDFSGLAAANNGRIYIYECARLRAGK
jgi:hypothetical protein